MPFAAMHDLARAFDAAGFHRDAQELFGHVVHARTRLLGPEHSDTVSTKGWLAISFKTRPTGKTQRDTSRRFWNGSAADPAVTTPKR